MELPDAPSVEVRAKKEALVPKGAIELVADGVGALEVIADVQDDLASPGFLDQADELAQLFFDFHRTGSGAAVTGQLEVNGGREGIAVGSSDIEEVASLVRAGRAQGEVMVGARSNPVSWAPREFSSKRSSVKSPPSVAFMYANVMPSAATRRQSMTS